MNKYLNHKIKILNKIISSLIKFNENDRLHYINIVNHTNINTGQILIVPSLIKINRLLLWI